MIQLKDLVVFRNDLYFDGAVQADWFYQSQQAEAVAKSFVFHGPKIMPYHKVMLVVVGC